MTPSSPPTVPNVPKGTWGVRSGRAGRTLLETVQGRRSCGLRSNYEIVVRVVT
ncbi:hypothetical protein ACVWZB_004773 [Paenibacillus polymyxa]